MVDLLHNSLLWALWQWLVKQARSSLLGGLIWRLGQSRLAESIRAGLARRPAAERSRLAGIAAWGNGLLSRVGCRLRRIAAGSLTVAGLRALHRALKNSLLLGWIFRAGSVRCLLTMLGLFGVIDWLLRDVLTIPVFSSVWDEALLLLGLLLFLWQRLKARDPLAPRTNVQTLPMLQFFAVCLALFAATTTANAVDLAVEGFRATAQSILWFPILIGLLRDVRDVKRLYLIMVLAAFVISLHGIYQFIVAVPIPENWTDSAEQSVRTRVFSIFSSPNIMGDFMLLFAPMALGAAYYVKPRRLKVLFVGMTLSMCLGCLFTMSRGAWVGLVLAAVVFALLADLRLLGLLFAGSILSLAIPFVSSRILYLFSDAFAASAARGGRQMRWAKAISYLYGYSNPLLGLGFGRFGGAVAVKHPASPIFEYFYVDNYYVKTLSENGYIGLGSFILMMLGLLWSGFRSWYARRRESTRPLISGMLAGLSGVLLHCYFENIFEEPYMLAYFWIVAAMMVFLGMEAGREKPEKNSEKTEKSSLLSAFSVVE